MTKEQDQWVEKFKQGLRYHLKRINRWHELKLKHEDHRLTLERRSENGRTFVFYGTTIVLVHESDLH